MEEKKSVKMLTQSHHRPVYIPSHVRRRGVLGSVVSMTYKHCGKPGWRFGGVGDGV